MADFLLDLRPPAARRLRDVAPALRYVDDAVLSLRETGDFGLATTSVDDPELWGAFEAEDGGFAALVGRLALDEDQWQAGGAAPGRGGPACGYLYQRYRDVGVSAFGELDGNFAALVFDPAARRLHLSGDAWGVFPCFVGEAGGGRVFGSQPDVVAAALGVEEDWDRHSLAEFLLCGRVTHPFTYYTKVRSAGYGQTFSFRFSEGTPPELVQRSHRRRDLTAAGGRDDDELAERMAAALARAVARRTLPRLGPTALGLSGGLDSRAVLGSAEAPERLLAFCCFDEENRELELARAIADAAGAELLPLRRGFDHYAETARLAVRISGGMGDIGNNHFLGFRSRLRERGIRNLLTGCYCDYLFKGLALDKTVDRFTRRERPGPFRLEHYHRHAAVDSPYRPAVEARQRAEFADLASGPYTDEARLEAERRRVFPLCYEADNLQRLIPQRLMGWYPPTIDRELVDLFFELAPEQKLNRAVFKRMVRRVCDPRIAAIPDANTGVAITAPRWVAIAGRYGIALRRRRELRRRSIRSAESWPNWGYYLRHSAMIRSLFEPVEPATRDALREIAGPTFYRPRTADYPDPEARPFLRLLTLKLWIDQRLGVEPEGDPAAASSSV